MLKIPNIKNEAEIFAFIAEKSASYHALNSLIESVESRASVRKFGNAAVFLENYFSKIVKHFENFTLAEKENLSVQIYSYSGTFPNSYTRKGSPQCSRICLTFKRGKWIVDCCDRVSVPKNTYYVDNLPEKAREKLIKNFCNF